MPKKIVITGGPGSGKTTLINYLKEQGFQCQPEISRDITIEAQNNGIEQLFMENPLLFSEKLLEGRLKQFIESEKFEKTYIFFDRGLPDVTAYLDYINSQYPDHFLETCNSYRYDTVFLLPPWKDIYKQDNERYESFNEAVIIYNYLLKGYQNYGYGVIKIPLDSIENRSKFILKKLTSLH